jgi:peptide/nickel transport system permease protein
MMAILSRIRKSLSITVGGTLLLLVLLVAVFASSISGADPDEIDVTRRLAPPGPGLLLGADHLGRDLFSRMLHGTRISLLVGSATALVATVAGVILGLVGGYSARIGNPVMRVVDGLMAFPGTILALALMAVLGPRLVNIVLALTIVYTPRVARVEHAAVLQTRRKEFVQAAVSLGGGDAYVLARHVFPNTLPPVLIQGTFIFAYAIIAEAGLSFLGVGIPPSIPSWGNLIAGGRDFLLVAPRISIVPGVAIFIVVLALNLVGDGLRDLLDPRLRGQGPGAGGGLKTTAGGAQ